MECQVSQQQDDIVIIHVKGEVDLCTSPELRALILQYLKKSKSVLVELSAVAYIDSSGIASLVEGYQLSRQHQLTFALISVNKTVASVLKLAKLDKVFQIYPSLYDWQQHHSSSQ